MLGLLGAGGFAQVYEVRARDGARRALKILDAEAEARPKVRARLAQEGAALTMLDHANVVRLHDAGVDGERIYLVLELVEGRNLRETLCAPGRPPPLETRVRWIHQAAEGVAAAHGRGIIHRDLKPENLLVTPDEVVKVIDFGIAKLTGWGVRTTHEQRMGTALYMSPEQIQGRAPDARMDVYALGLILYEAVAGAHPLVTAPASVFEICARQLNHRPRPLAEAAPEVPPELGALVDQAIEKDPARRPPGMRAFADALQAVLLRLGEDRRAPASSGSRFSITDPLPSSPRSLAHLTRTEPLGGALSFAVTAPLGTLDSDEATTLPNVLGAPAVIAPPAPSLAPPAFVAESAPPALAAERTTAPSVPAVLAVVLTAMALGVAGGIWVVTRVIPWLF